MQPYQVRFGTAYTQATKMNAAVSVTTVFSYCVSANKVNGIVSYEGVWFTAHSLPQMR
jgi:hypothetical protein